MDRTRILRGSISALLCVSTAPVLAETGPTNDNGEVRLRPPISAGAKQLDSQTSINATLNALDILDNPDTDNGPALSSFAGNQIEIRFERPNTDLHGLKFLHICVTNRTKLAVVLDGDNTTITADQLPQKPLSMNAVESRIKSFDKTFPQKQLQHNIKATIVAATTVGAIQTIQDDKRQRGPILNRYGWDEQRRQDQLARFAKRVLFPGESTEGDLFIETAPSGKLTIEMPVWQLYNEKNTATIKATQ